MKFTKYFMPFAALAVLASCSNDNVSEPQPTDPVIQGDAYMAINIAMPSNAGTKAPFDESTDLLDGDANEFAVKNGTVYIFKTATGDEDIPEDNYTYVTSGSLNTTNWANKVDNPNQVTVEATTAIVEVTGSSLATEGTDFDYYALVILNKPSALGAPASQTTTFKTWRTQELANIEGSLENGFTMTNAPQFAQLTGDNAPTYHTLVKIDKTKIKSTPQNLESAADIYVQRIVAKVDLTFNTSKYDSDTQTFTVEKPNTTYGDADEVEFEYFDLAYTNTKSYPVQNAQNYSAWNAIVGKNQPWLSSASFKRIYWTEDWNYSTTAENALTSYSASNTDMSTVFYPLENTMAPKQMVVANTTTAVLKGTYKVHGEEGSFVATNTWKQGLGSSFTTKYPYLTVKDVAAGSAKLTEVVEVNDEVLGDNWDAINSVLGTSITESEENSKSLGNDNKKALILAAFGQTEDIDVTFYKDGEIYYKIPIRHFEDSEAPKPANFASANDYDDKATGRFGLVRNNWYTINVNSITGLGEPTPPTPDKDKDIPDDPKDKQYIMCTINILSWAKRSHDYNL